jgi:hypothetical protein
MGLLMDWYVDWLEKQNMIVTEFNKKVFDPNNYSELLRILRDMAQDTEDGERDPKTGISMWPKEKTAEWQAADLLESYKAEIDKYEEKISNLIDLAYAQRMVLGLTDELDKK